MYSNGCVVAKQNCETCFHFVTSRVKKFLCGFGQDINFKIKTGKLRRLGARAWKYDSRVTRIFTLTYYILKKSHIQDESYVFLSVDSEVEICGWMTDVSQIFGERDAFGNSRSDETCKSKVTFAVTLPACLRQPFQSQLQLTRSYEKRGSGNFRSYFR